MSLRWEENNDVRCISIHVGIGCEIHLYRERFRIPSLHGIRGVQVEIPTTHNAP